MENQAREKEFVLDRGAAGDIMDAGGNLKDVLEKLNVAYGIACSSRDGKRELFAQTVVIQSALDDAIEHLSGELRRILPGIDQLRRQSYSPEKYEQMKANGVFDDERYLKGDAT